MCFFKSPAMVLLFPSFSQFSSLPPVRVVFAVTMEGSARKVITVRSALIVKNRLETPMELRLDSPSAPDSEFCHSLSSFYLERVRLLGGRPFAEDADLFFCGRARGASRCHARGFVCCAFTSHVLAATGPAQRIGCIFL